MKTLAVVIIAYNEEKNIAKCLESVKQIADEIIVVDCESSDKTGAVAKKFTKNVYERPNNPLMKINMNYGFSKAKSDWIFSLDADEQVSPELAKELQIVLETENDVAGYSIPRKNIIFGKWIENSIWWPDYQLRLFKNGKGKFAEKHVHEQLDVDGEVGKLEQPILHENYTAINQWLHKMEIYTDNEAHQRIEKGEAIKPLDALRYPVHDFLQTYFLQKGYRDGLHGLVLSLLQAFYAEIVFAKMWEHQGFEQTKDPQFIKQVIAESHRLGQELSYWITTIAIENTTNTLGKTLLKIKRKATLQKIHKK